MLQVIMEETESRGRNNKLEEQEEKAEEEDSLSVRTSPREKRPSVLPEDCIDPEQVGNLICFEIVVLCVLVLRLNISENLFLQETVMEGVTNYDGDTQPRVKYACCDSIDQVSTDFAPVLEKKVQTKVIPGRLVLPMNDSDNPRVQVVTTDLHNSFNINII